MRPVFFNCANKTARKLQTDHGPRKTGAGPTVQQKH